MRRCRRRESCQLLFQPRHFLYNPRLCRACHDMLARSNRMGYIALRQATSIGPVEMDQRTSRNSSKVGMRPNWRDPRRSLIGILTPSLAAPIEIVQQNNPQDGRNVKQIIESIRPCEA